MPVLNEKPPVRLNKYTANKSMTKSIFLHSMSDLLADFLKMMTFVLNEEQEHPKYSLRFYKCLTEQAELAEQLLDSCGAKENRAWFLLRELTATILCFSRVAYVLRSLEHQVASYDILDQETLEFQVISGNVRAVFDRMFPKAFAQFVNEARNLGVTVPNSPFTHKDFPSFRSPGRLYKDLLVDRSSAKVEEAIVKIATSYLEVAEEYTSLGFSKIFPAQVLADMVPEHVNEERLRTFEAEVHNLQSVYDTYIQYTGIEASDPRLQKLRGCVATALRLLEIATVLVHFHERHERNSRHVEIYRHLQEVTGTYQILDIMGNYALFYCTRFLQKGKQLSEEAVMLYAQITSKRIPIPMYRGFHVRPSTYIAKIARHYGAELEMHLDDEVYDASCVFDLFRANEKINMEKRRLIAKRLISDSYITAATKTSLSNIMKRELKCLLDEELIVTHQEILPEDLIVPDIDKEELSAEDVRQMMNECITRLLALGKIDILMSLSVTFIGDKRSLHDIEILARTGYGEDEKGNNVPLPEEISYLYK